MTALYGVAEGSYYLFAWWPAVQNDMEKVQSRRAV
jgi:hypothetical protein